MVGGNQLIVQVARVGLIRSSQEKKEKIVII